MEGLTSEKVEVRGKTIHVLRSGHGQQVLIELTDQPLESKHKLPSQAVLLLPGALGSAATDWMTQVD